MHKEKFEETKIISSEIISTKQRMIVIPKEIFDGNIFGPIEEPFQTNSTKLIEI